MTLSISSSSSHFKVYGPLQSEQQQESHSQEIWSHTGVRVDVGATTTNSVIFKNGSVYSMSFNQPLVSSFLRKETEKLLAARQRI